MRLKDYHRFAEWIWDVESSISQSIADCASRAWNEDHISYTWLNAMRKNNRYIGIPSWPRPFSIAWDGYKADGALEESHGDIAILVKQTFPNKSELLGVGFLEAKRSYKTSGRYAKIDWAQLNRQNGNTAHHKLLLYDHDPVILNHHTAWSGIFPFSHPHPMWEKFAYYCEKYARDFQTYACVCPSRHAIAYRTRTKKLHELCVPLSHQICLRYFFGHDLDYNPQLVADVLNGVADGIDYLLVAHVSFGEGGESSVDTIPFNRDAYTQPENEREQ